MNPERKYVAVSIKHTDLPEEAADKLFETVLRNELNAMNKKLEEDTK